MVSALMALKLKGRAIRGVREGSLIIQRGKPDLLLTWEAAVKFADQVDEAEHG